MKRPQYFPSPQQVLDDLRTLVPIVYSALEDATQSARDFFDLREVRVDVSLYPALVRYHAKMTLAAAGQTVEEDQSVSSNSLGPAYDWQSLANNGLSLKFSGENGRYHVRILKADHGQLPLPGQSRARQAFYAQQGFQLEFDITNSSLEVIDHTDVNVVILWEEGQGFLLSRLILALPKNDSLEPARVVAEYLEIPHPAESHTPSGTSQEAEDVFEEDLAIRPRQRPKTETEYSA